jgi:hypothetical protein
MMLAGGWKATLKAKNKINEEAGRSSSTGITEVVLVNFPGLQPSDS